MRFLNLRFPLTTDQARQKFDGQLDFKIDLSGRSKHYSLFLSLHGDLGLSRSRPVSVNSASEAVISACAAVISACATVTSAYITSYLGPYRE